MRKIEILIISTRRKIEILIISTMKKIEILIIPTMRKIEILIISQRRKIFILIISTRRKIFISPFQQEEDLNFIVSLPWRKITLNQNRNFSVSWRILHTRQDKPV